MGCEFCNLLLERVAFYGPQNEYTIKDCNSVVTVSSSLLSKLFFSMPLVLVFDGHIVDADDTLKLSYVRTELILGDLSTDYIGYVYSKLYSVLCIHPYGSTIFLLYTC